MRDVAAFENLDQAKTLAHQHHVFAELSLALKISAMRRSPISEAAVAFAFLVGKGSIDVVVPAVSYFDRFDHAARIAAAVDYDPAFTGRRGVRLILGAAGRGLEASQHKVEQLICQRGSIAECERAQAPIFFGNGTHELNPPASVGISSGLNP